MRMQLDAPCTFDNCTRSGSPHNVLHSSSYYTTFIPQAIAETFHMRMREAGLSNQFCQSVSRLSVSRLSVSRLSVSRLSVSRLSAGKK